MNNALHKNLATKSGKLRKPRPLGRGVTGFTLAEILISLVILALGIVFVFNIFPLGLQSLIYSRRLNEISYLAQKKFEDIKSQARIELGETSGEEGDLSWQVSTKPLKLQDNIEVICLEMNIGFDFQGTNHKQKFVTYLLGE